MTNRIFLTIKGLTIIDSPSINILNLYLLSPSIMIMRLKRTTISFSRARRSSDVLCQNCKINDSTLIWMGNKSKSLLKLLQNYQSSLTIRGITDLNNRDLFNAAWFRPSSIAILLLPSQVDTAVIIWFPIGPDLDSSSSRTLGYVSMLLRLPSLIRLGRDEEIIRYIKTTTLSVGWCWWDNSRCRGSENCCINFKGKRSHS